MHHLLLTCGLIAVAFGVLSRRYPADTVHGLLAGLPMLTFLVGMIDEYLRGIQQFNHQMLHIAYDSSYALLLVGIILVGRAALRRKLIVTTAAGTCIAGMPLAYLIITQQMIGY